MGTETKKIWVTLPENHINALEIIAEDFFGGSRNKAQAISDMINVYVDTKKEKLKEYDAYQKIITALKGKEFNETYVHKINFIEDYIKKFVDDDALEQEFYSYQQKKDKDGIDKLYQEIEGKIEYLKAVKKERKFIQTYLDQFGPDKEVFMKFTLYEDDLDAEGIKKLYNQIKKKMA